MQLINLKQLDAGRNERVEESLSLSDQQIFAYTEMLKEWPNDMVLRRGLADGYSSKAVLFMNEKRNEQALLALDKSVELNEKNSVANLDDVLMFANVGRVYYYHARANIKLHNFDAAVQDLIAGTQRFAKADTVALPPAMRKMQCQSLALIVAIATKQKKMPMAISAEQAIQVLAQKQPSLFAEKPVKVWLTEARGLLTK